uniref:ClpC1 n=2 Tax=Babesia TaxID=5864 RepID=A0A411ADD1_9APIC|nr:ClpC1 [Babesia sp. Lintan]QAX27049.1 ClpC1 [Babesia motasi]QAX27080.1 ClpC1 [Babesia motasi]
MNLIHMFFTKKYSYYIYLIISKYIYTQIYEYFILTSYNKKNVSYIIDLDKIFTTLLSLDSKYIYLLQKQSIEFIFTKCYNKELYLQINTLVIDSLYGIYKFNNKDTLYKNIFTMTLFNNKTLIFFKSYDLFLEIAANINLLNIFLTTFKHLNLVFILTFDDNSCKKLNKLLEDSKLPYKLSRINSLISVKSSKQNKNVNVHIKKFLNFCEYNNINNTPTIDYIKNILHYYPIFNVISKKNKLSIIKDYINKYFNNNVLLLDPLLKSINKTFTTANENKPLGNFLLCGPSGSGKTELVKILTYAMFSSTKHLIKLNMSEYMEPHSISKLIGSPPGYIGYSSDNEFVSKVKSNNKSIILFDEIEKAHKSINDLMLQILEESRLTLSNGDILKFNNSFICFTSNLGCDSSLTYNNKLDYDYKILKSIKDFFRPEFISRINNIIIFDPVEFKNCMDITDNIIKKLSLNYANFSYFNTNFKKEYIKYSYNILYGVRPLYKLNELIFTKIGEHSNKLCGRPCHKHINLLTNINIQNFEYSLFPYINKYF